MLVGGLAVLIGGGEVLVRGAGSLARTFGMAPLIVGLTVVSFATSAPELAVSMGAAFTGSPGLAVGNVVGSNVANILLILGLSALFLPLVVKSQLVRADIPVMVVMAVAMLLVALDGLVSRTDGLILVTALVIYLVVTVLVARRRKLGKPPRRPPGRVSARRRSPLLDVGLVVLGVGLLVGGAQLLVRGATDIAAAFGVSDLIIGLTVVAIGTSLPELATSIIAVIRGERELAVGNVVGSNVFNVGAVLGTTALVAPDGVEVAASAVRFDIPIMVAVSLVLLPVAFTGQAIARWEGGLFVALFVAYVAYLYLEATDHAALEPFSAAMLWFVIPITALWLLLLVAYEIGLRRGKREARPSVR
nr:calcium/sodium antiporter [Phytoactinopolyspora alkaliphila]